ncbi:hypothetical protein OH76DRAFT_653836 [Lentinus brumalis]|uniref:Uncharacterized protein n=1 Tax=Lentinus brumalis TaxID=2498619 RepID=A0A371D7E4_9APHY|nr:hypothetical protein OH76DRAFT_653836 [Polyporus brumalis]
MQSLNDDAYQCLVATAGHRGLKSAFISRASPTLKIIMSCLFLRELAITFTGPPSRFPGVLYTRLCPFSTLPSDLCVTETRDERMEVGVYRTRSVEQFVRMPVPDDFKRWYKYVALVHEVYQDYFVYHLSCKISVQREVWILLSQHGPSPLLAYNRFSRNWTGAATSGHRHLLRPHSASRPTLPLRCAR